MKKLKIVTSKANIYTDQVKKLKDESELLTEVIYIEDLVSCKMNLDDFKNSIVYFLCCNSSLIPTAIQKLEEKKCYIINKDYLIRNYLKLDIQMLLYKNNVNVPEIYYIEDIENIRFPIFCKENKHEGIIAQLYNKMTLTRFFDKFDSSEFYLEQSISIGAKEFKVYFVDGKIFSKNMKIDKKLDLICENISVALNKLEVFSTDIIQNFNGDYYVIDVNPSAGFYLSDNGRKYFLDILKKI